jgi:hypothetical protein
MIGGSFASGIYGIPRMTNDADLLADVKAENIDELVNELKKEFYIDSSMIQNAIKMRSSFNIIHLESMFKIDIFIPQTNLFDKSQFNRRKLEKLDEKSDDKIYITSPEDIILIKLDWFRKGGEVSDRQYRDVLGVIKVQSEGKRLDWEYLKYWAEKIGIIDLLERVAIDAAK